MTKRGKVPSLISGASGKPKIVVARRTRHCKRCECELPPRTTCVEIPTPGSMGRRTYCPDCVLEMIDKSREDLNILRRDLQA